MGLLRRRAALQEWLEQVDSLLGQQPARPDGGHAGMRSGPPATGQRPAAPGGPPAPGRGNSPA